MTAHLSGPVAVIRANMGDIRPVKRALPLKLWLSLEDDVNRHREEIAEQFKEARARLLPEAFKPSHYVGDFLPDAFANYYQRAWMDAMSGLGAVGAWRDPYTGASIIHNNADAYHDRRGLFGLGFMGL